MKKKIKKLIIKLSNYINYHNYRYYILNKPTITNYKYDTIFNKLIKLEKKYNFYYKKSPTKNFNYNILKNDKKIKHYYRMCSINNVYNKKELLLWLKNINNKIDKKYEYDYICELKYDGIAISLIYKYGILNSAITRGDGKYGNNILKNILLIKDIPLFFKKINNIKLFDIKGEIVYSKKTFNFLNKLRIKEGLKKFSNPRNAVNGIIHNYNKKYNIIYKKKINFVPYLIYTNNNKFNFNINNQFKVINFLNNFYFKYQKKSYKLCKNTNDIIDFIIYWEKNIHNSIYPIDGIVIKINNFLIQNKLKNNNIFHKWCIAYKFKDREYITILKEIMFTIGKSGIIVPIIKLKPIKISGTIVKKATLYNSNIFFKYNLYYNDKIIIKKSGDIIPKIIKNITYNKKEYKYINYPLYCPSCKNLLKKINNKIYCLNFKKCLKQRIEVFKHFISKNAMNIKINKNIIKKLLINKIIKNVSDFYSLKIYHLMLVNTTYKVAKRIILEIKKSKKKKISNILFALCIPYIGLNISKKIETKYNTIFSFLKDIKSNNLKIGNFGEKKIKIIKKYFNKKNLIIIKKLKNIGLNI
ncbi:MAG: NAD-dependent DNA ligase LigA [Candidatus Shikimatogenerans sp. JK-2022]|nr:NAD-dependent DNA ligase LigA [Candidatus Shikimatogenerans bostrichidophilus]